MFYEHPCIIPVTKCVVPIFFPNFSWYRVPNWMVPKKFFQISVSTGYQIGWVVQFFFQIQLVPIFGYGLVPKHFDPPPLSQNVCWFPQKNSRMFHELEGSSSSRRATLTPSGKNVLGGGQDIQTISGQVSQTSGGLKPLERRRSSNCLTKYQVHTDTRARLHDTQS